MVTIRLCAWKTELFGTTNVGTTNVEINKVAVTCLRMTMSQALNQSAALLGKASLAMAAGSLIALIILGAKENPHLILSLSFFTAAGISLVAHLRRGAYSFWIICAVVAALTYPQYFTQIGDFNLKNLIVPLLQIIMFGMGTAMSLADFVSVARTPKAVGIGLACQLTIMPIVGFSIAYFFNFPPEIAAGIILVGCSPSGLASNVMAYIAKSNLALSVSLTAIATLLAPITTPLLMKIFAGEFIPIDFWAMMWSITKIVILPIIAGLAFNYLLHGKAAWLDRAMPLVSMFGIAIIITVITAAGREHLLEIGLALLLASLIHNVLGYLFGYNACRLFKLDEKSCRSIAFEVGMQNTGLASGIALEMGRVATLGLAPSVFGPMMNVTGSSLASFWKSRPTDSDQKYTNAN